MMTSDCLPHQVRENILFGLPFHQGRYSRCVARSALEADLAQLANGDATDVGEGGAPRRWRLIAPDCHPHQA